MCCASCVNSNLTLSFTAIALLSKIGGFDGVKKSNYQHFLVVTSTAGTTYELRRDCNCTLLQKTHDFTLFSVLYNAALNKTTEELLYRELKKFDGNGILLIRNPFKAILSYRNFAFGGDMAGMAPQEAFSQSLVPPTINDRQRSSKFEKNVVKYFFFEIIA